MESRSWSPRIGVFDGETILVKLTRVGGREARKLLTSSVDHVQVTSRGGAGTSFWSPDLNRYYVAAPASDNEDAAILVYEPQD